jgi:hypothetical protein
MAYNLKPITIENIGMGKLLEKANDGLQRIAQDAIGRCKNGKPRKLTIEIEISPNADDESEVNMPDIGWEVKWSLPGEKGMTARGIVDRIGRETRFPVYQGEYESES